MKNLDNLREMFSVGSLVDVDGERLTFEGYIGDETNDLTDVESQIGYGIPSNVASFIKYFGGTKLFVDTFGLGISIINCSVIVAHNLEQQKTTGRFWPQFMIFGYSSSDDMLILFSDNNEPTFGILDHEAWETPKDWMKEAISQYDFDTWLNNLIETNGKIHIQT